MDNDINSEMLIRTLSVLGMAASMEGALNFVSNHQLPILYKLSKFSACCN